MSNVRIIMENEEKNEIEFNSILKSLSDKESEFLKNVRNIHEVKSPFAQKIQKIIQLFEHELIKILLKLSEKKLSLDESLQIINRANIFNHFTKAAFLEKQIPQSSLTVFENAHKNFLAEYRLKKLEMEKAKLEIQVEQLSAQLGAKDKIIGWLQGKLSDSEVDLKITQSRLEDKKTKASNQDSQSPSVRNFANHPNSMWASQQPKASASEKPLEKRSLRSCSI